MKFISDVRYVDQFRRYSRSKSKVVEIAPKFGRFSALQNFLGRALQKLYSRYHPYLTSRRLEEFREDTPTRPEVIEAHTLNFKPNFKFSGLIFLGGTPVPDWVCAR